MSSSIVDTVTETLPPGSLGLPLIGESIEFVRNPNTFAQTRYEKYGPIFKTHILGAPTAIMAGPDAARFVLLTGMDHFLWRPGWPQSTKSLLGESLFVQDGEEHDRNRRLLTPAFHSHALEGYCATVDTLTQQHLKDWSNQANVALFLSFKALTFDIVSRLFLGVAPGENVAEISRIFKTFSDGLIVVARTPLPWSRFGRAMRSRATLMRYVENAIQERRKNPTADVLSLLLLAGENGTDRLSPEEISAQILLMLVAGHETTPSMVTWACWELARHPEILRRARAEQAQIAHDGPLNLADTGRMPYLDQILREVERLHPAIIGGFRGVVKPFTFNGYTVPAGWKVLYSIPTTHQIADTYPEPERFDPDRFAPGHEEHKKQAFSLIGFGGGPRVCLGMPFAQMQLKVMLARLLRDYEWHIPEPAKTRQSYLPVSYPSARASFQQKSR